MCGYGKRLWLPQQEVRGNHVYVRMWEALVAPPTEGAKGTLVLLWLCNGEGIYARTHVCVWIWNVSEAPVLGGKEHMCV